jgi:hypothetical protein
MSKLRDLYIRKENEPGFDENRLEVFDELESTIQQIKMTLFTRKGEVLGEPNYGVEVDRYLFEFSIDPFGIKQDASDQINTYVSGARKKTITVNPASYQDDRVGREIFVLLINIPELNNSLSIFYD